MTNADPFDPAALRLTQDFSTALGVRKIVTSIPVRKPDRQKFIRVNPDAAMQLETVVLELKEESETYLVLPEILKEAPDEFVPKALRLVVDRQENLSLWPLRLPDPTGRLDDWSRSAMMAAKHAEQKWIRVVSNRAVGAYEIFEAIGEIPEPTWPEIPLREILRLAFRDRLIDRPDHPALLRLRGQR